MNIYDEIDTVPDFQEKLRESVRRACDLIVSYIGGLQKHLPEIAAQGFNVALKCKKGSTLPDESEIKTARVQIVNSLREWGAYSTQYPMEHRYHLFDAAINTLLMSEVWHRMVGIFRLISFSVR